MLEPWGMQSMSSLPSFPGPIWLGVVTPKKFLSMGQMELLVIQTERKNVSYLIKLFQIKMFDHLNVCKKRTDVDLDG